MGTENVHANNDEYPSHDKYRSVNQLNCDEKILMKIIWMCWPALERLKQSYERLYTFHFPNIPIKFIFIDFAKLNILMKFRYQCVA